MTNKEALEVLRSVMPGTDNDKVFQAIQESIKALEQEPKTGHWIGIDEEPHEDYECDKCGFIHTFIDGHTSQYNYCPNCGARMESEVRNETNN